MADENLTLAAFKCTTEMDLNKNSSHLGNDEKSSDKTVSAVRSIAVIKKSQVEFPVSFRELQSNTDLKTPPSNWLRGQFSVCFPNLAPKHSDFTSFIMGYQFPDCIGEVDIVSDAENIKKLLKMAYHPNTHLSMMVHRIGKTILIDEFDIYKYLLRQSQCEWKWLRKFFYEHVLESLARKEENVVVRPNKSRDVVQNKNLLSKFLYYSIGDEKMEENTNQAQSQISSPTKDTLLELPVEEHILNSSMQSFTQNIIWNFEDVRMLIGTDLPIFGGRTHPCVSLRLRDMDKPINILTGIDYWLDNLMCNVPEVLMCYHQNGIVQKYELVKTEDLPNMSDSQFSPQLVRDIAHNILSFLKSKATKEGHTYWLFKGKDDDIVKLYDLTSLCQKDDYVDSFLGCMEDCDTSQESGDNPFTVPVAMLLYCVAKNIWNSKEAANEATTVKSLLENALCLLKKDKYPKIFCHSHLILADLYIPQDLDPDRPRFFDLEEGEIDLTKGETPFGAHISPEGRRERKKKKTPLKECECNSINLATLCSRHGFKGSKQKTNEPPKLSKNLYERCHSAVDHAISALKFLQSCPPETSSSPQSPNIDLGVGREPTSAEWTVPDEPKMAPHCEPIPMPYKPLHESQPVKGETFHSPSPEEKGGEEEVPPRKSSPNLQCVPTHQESTEVDESFQNHQKQWFLPPAGWRRQNAIVSKTILTGSVLNAYLKDASWEDKIKFQLLRKVSLVYMTKGRIELNKSNYGFCLQYVNLSLQAWCGMMPILGVDQEYPLPVQPLLLAGDAYYNLSQNWAHAPSHLQDFKNLSKEQEEIVEILNERFCQEEKSVLMPCDRVQSLMFSYQAFEAAMSATNTDPDFELKRHLAGICNELGCLFMNQADTLCQDLKEGLKSGGDLWNLSLRYLDKAINIFEEVKDYDNSALLHCNKGRYLRLFAFYTSLDCQQILTPIIQETYEKAFDHYEKAHMISRQSIHKHVAESVIWEYSSTLFSYATIIQDTPCINEDSEYYMKYAVQTYHKCLKLCDRKFSTSKEPLFQYRAAEIHIRLAAIYHEKFRQKRDVKMADLAAMHYQRSASHFLHIDSSPSDIFKVHLDQVVLKEDIIEGIKNPMNKWKLDLAILKLLMQCSNGLLLMECKTDKKQIKVDETFKENRLKGKAKKETARSITEDEDLLNSFLELYEKKLHSTLLAMLKIIKCNAESFSCEADVKKMYSISLNKANKPKDVHLLEAVKSIKPIVQLLGDRI